MRQKYPSRRIRSLFPPFPYSCNPPLRPPPPSVSMPPYVQWRFRRSNYDKQQASSIPGGRGSPRRCSTLRAIAAAVSSGVGLTNDAATFPCVLFVFVICFSTAADTQRQQAKERDRERDRCHHMSNLRRSPAHQQHKALYCHIDTTHLRGEHVNTIFPRHVNST